MKTQASHLIAGTFPAACPKTILPMSRQRKRITGTMLVVAALCLCFLPPATSAPGSWTQKADMPASTTSPGSCVVDGILYVVGGCYPYQTALATAWAYDPKVDLWTRKTDLPVARRWPGAAAANGTIYVVGGGVGWPDATVLPVAAYDPKTDTWAAKAKVPTGRLAPAACSVDGIIYAISGFTVRNVVLARVEAYDPKTDQWTRKSDVPKPIYFATASVVDGVIYLFWETYTFAYDPKTDRWTAKARFSPSSFGLRSAAVDGIIYVFGGFTENGLMPGFDFALAYDPVQDRVVTRGVRTGISGPRCTGDFLPTAPRVPVARTLAANRTRHLCQQRASASHPRRLQTRPVLPSPAEVIVAVNSVCPPKIAAPPPQTPTATRMGCQRPSERRNSPAFQ